MNMVFSLTLAVVCRRDVRQYTRLVKKTCGTRGTAQIDRTEYCAQVSDGGGPSSRNISFLMPSFPYLAQHLSENCWFNFTCGVHRDAIFNSDASFYRCTCEENFGLVNEECRPCVPTQFLPGPVHRNCCFTCPEHTTLNTGQARSGGLVGRDVHDVENCRADPGYTLMEMLANVGDLLHENSQHAMYAVEPCDLCHKQTVCSVMFSLATAPSSA